MCRRVSFVPNRILAVAAIVASGIVLGTSVRADYLKCINDEGQLAFVNTGNCPAGYSLSETNSENNSSRPASVSMGNDEDVVFVTSNCRRLVGLQKAKAPQGFSISPEQAFFKVQGAGSLSQKHCWEIYAYGKNYYVVDSFLGQSSSIVLKSGVIVDGQTGNILDRSAASPDQRSPIPAASGEKVPTIWELGFGDPAAQKWLQKKLTDTSGWTAEGRASTPEKVWNEMKSALLPGDTEKAVRYFSPFTRDLYREMFQTLGAKARVMAQQMKELIRREKSDFGAAYWLPRDAEVDGRIEHLVFAVSFIRGGDGVWLIDRF